MSGPRRDPLPKFFPGRLNMPSKTKHLIAGILITLIMLGITVTTNAQEKVEVPTLVFASGAVGGTWNPIASTIVEKAHENMIGRPITVRPGSGGKGNPELVSKGIADLGISYGPFLILAAQGKEPYTQKFDNLRAVMGLVINDEYFLIDPQYEVKTFDEIIEQKMKLKIGTGMPGSGDRFLIELILKSHGITFQDTEDWGMKWDLAGTTARINAWKDRHIDLFNSFILTPASAVSQSAHARTGNFIGLSDKTRKYLVDEWGYLDSVIPADLYPNQPNEVPTVSLPFMIFAREDVSDDAIYLLTKAAAENKDFIASAVKAVENWKPENMWKGLGVELHPGAVRYYKERGWIKE